MSHTYYSMRTGINENSNGYSLDILKDLFLRAYKILVSEGFFDEYFGSYCVDQGDIPGKIKDIDLDILLKVRKKDLWPIDDMIRLYTEDDLFDIIEYLYQNVSKPIDGTYHNYNDCGMHWETFNKNDGQQEYLNQINDLLKLYEKPFELSKNGEILHKPEVGFESIFEADIPSDNDNILSRVNSAIHHYRRHGSTLDDRRQSVRDLADVLEYLRVEIKSLLTKQDESELFNIANSFGIRHHNDKQKTNYDTSIWLSWMFYYYLATIHVVLRMMAKEKFNK